MSNFRRVIRYISVFVQIVALTLVVSSCSSDKNDDPIVDTPTAPSIHAENTTASILPASTGSDIQQLTAGTEIIITVVTRDSNEEHITRGGGNVNLVINGPNATVSVNKVDNNDGSYAFTFIPTQVGIDEYSVHIVDQIIGTQAFKKRITATVADPIKTQAVIPASPFNASIPVILTALAFDQYDNETEANIMFHINGDNAGDLPLIYNNTLLRYEADFTPTTGGTSVFTMSVDGVTVSGFSESRDISANEIPVANAGVDFVSSLNSVVTLDGSKSSDPEEATLQYNWVIATKPSTSVATISATNPGNDTATFTADQLGIYTINLIVNDGLQDSVADTVSVEINSLAELFANTTYATPTRLKIATNDNGDSLAVWSMESGAGKKHVYSFKPANGQWSADKLLPNGLDHRRFMELASNGTEFIMATYTSGTHIHRFDGTDWVDDAPAPSYTEFVSIAVNPNGTEYMLVYGYANSVHSGRYFLNTSTGNWEFESFGLLYKPTNRDTSLKLTNNGGNGYALIWKNTTDLFASVYDLNTETGSMEWSTPGAIDSEIPDVSSFQIASNGDADIYVATWTQGGSIYSNIYHSSDKAWSGAALIENDATAANFPVLASNGSNFAVAWIQNFAVNSRFYNFDNTSQLWQWSQPEINSLTSSATNLGIASNGSGYALSWKNNQITFADIYYQHPSTGIWDWTTSDTQINSPIGSTQNVTLTASGDNYAIVWQQNEPSPSTVKNLLARKAIFNSQTNSWDWPATQALETLTNTVVIDRNNFIAPDAQGNIQYAWIQFDGVQNQVYHNVFTGNSPAAPTALVQNRYHGSVNNAIIAHNNNSDIMAVWVQHNNGKFDLFAQLYSNSTWGDPKHVAENIENHSHSVKSNGVDFMIMYRVGISYQVNKLYAVPYLISNNTGIGASMEVSGNSLVQSFYTDMTSNGNTFAFIWNDTNSSTHSRIYNPPANNSPGWGNSESISSDITSVKSIKLSSNGSGYAAIMLDTNNQAFVRLMNSGVWDTSSNPISPQGIGQNIGLTSNGDGYALSWTLNDGVTTNVFANIFSNNSGVYKWDGEQPIENLATSAIARTKISSSNGGYMVVWQETNGPYYASIFENNAQSQWQWKPEHALNNCQSISIAASSHSYGVNCDTQYHFYNYALDALSNPSDVGSWKSIPITAGLRVTTATNGNEYIAAYTRSNDFVYQRFNSTGSLTPVTTIDNSDQRTIAFYHQVIESPMLGFAAQWIQAVNDDPTRWKAYVYVNLIPAN